MRHRGTLRTRIILAFSIFGLALSGVLAIGWLMGMIALEASVIDDVIEAELQYFLTQTTNRARQKDFSSRTTAIYVTPIGDYEDLPNELYALEPGTHDSTINGRDYRTLVRDVGDNRYFLRYDDTTILQRQRYSSLILIASVVLATCLSAWFGYQLSGQIISPVIRLANDIDTLEADTKADVNLDDYADDELGMLARKFGDYRARFQELLEREKEFAGNVSHELRTPLTNINLAVEVLANEPSISKESKQRLDRIRRAGVEMSELVSAFLILAQAEATNSAESASCDVNAVVRQAMEDQKIWLRNKPVDVCLREQGQLQVSAPPRVVSVLFSNLIRNAYRHTARGRIHISVHEHSVTVEDSGSGIDIERQKHLFERNFHGHFKTGDGMGIGLSIVRRICERYGWEVKFESKVGQGTRFDVIF